MFLPGKDQRNQRSTYMKIQTIESLQPYGLDIPGENNIQSLQQYVITVTASSFADDELTYPAKVMNLSLV